MKVYEKGNYAIVSFTCANRRMVEVVKNYVVLQGIPIWEDVEISIKLSHFDNRATTQNEINSAIEISKIYIDKLIESEY